MAITMKYLLGIDFGGGASKATLLCENGTIAATNTVEYPTFYPMPGYTEQNPEDWYKATVENISAVLEKSSINPSDIEMISLDAATHTAVLTDYDFNVVRPSIYWTDTRSVKQAEFLKTNCRELIKSLVLHEPDTIWTLPQLMWLRENEPETLEKTKRIMFAKDYVRHCLTGDYVTDFIEAEGSMMFDYTRQEWSGELCSFSGIDSDMLPNAVSPLETAGYVTSAAAGETGLCEGTPVIVGSTDTVMEVFASGAVLKGQMTLKLATAGRICIITDKAYPDKNLINYSHVSDGLWYPGTATKSCAASYRWYRDTFGESYDVLDRGAETISPGADGLIFHPYLNGELTPYGNPSLRASFTGVSAGHTKAHFTRAVLEGVSMSLLDCKNEIEKIGIPHGDSAFVIGGGGKSPLWRKITADITGITLIENKYSDSSFGSCMLAGAAAGVWNSLSDAVSACNTPVSKTVPDSESHEKYLKIFAKYKDIQSALEAVYNKEY